MEMSHFFVFSDAVNDMADLRAQMVPFRPPEEVTVYHYHAEDAIILEVPNMALADLPPGADRNAIRWYFLSPMEAALISSDLLDLHPLDEMGDRWGVYVPTAIDQAGYPTDLIDLRPAAAIQLHQRLFYVLRARQQDIRVSATGEIAWQSEAQEAQ